MRQKLQRYDLLFSSLLVLAVMTMIFCFSGESGEESGKTSNLLVRAILAVFAPDYGEMSLERRVCLWNALSIAVRKTAHFTEYAMLGASLMLFAAALGKRIMLRFPFRWSFAFGVLYAASDEFHQLLVADRAASVIDVGIDSLGVLFGLSIIVFLRKQRALKRKKQP